MDFFLKYQARKLIRYFARQSFARLVTVFLFAALASFIGAATYFLTGRALAFVARDAYFRDAVTLYSYELFFALALGLIFLGALAAGMFAVYRRGEDAWLFHSPKFFLASHYAAWRIYGASIIPMLVVAVPFIWAVAAFFGLGVGEMALALAAVLAGAALAVIAAFVLIAGAGIVFARIAPAAAGFRAFAGVLAVIAASGAFFIWRHIAAADLGKLFDVHNLEAARAALEPIREAFWMLPSHLPATMLFELQQGSINEAIAALALLTLGVVFLGAIFEALSGRLLVAWQLFQEGSAGKPAGVRHPFIFSGERALLEKEAIFFLRNTRNLVWLGFLAFLLLIQTGMNSFLAANLARYELAAERLPAIVFSLECATILYFIAAFALRFVFPTLSAERRSVWVIAAAPVDLAKLFRAKLVFFSALFVAVGTVAAFATFATLAVPFGSALVFYAAAAVAATFITAFALGMGFAFPNFETDDPETLATSTPGLLFTVFAISYGIAVAGALWGALAGGAWYPLAGLGVLSAVGIVALFKNAPRFVERIEFTPATERERL